ncbi:uncharacterized protein LOC143793206 isoform X2 [Ranitomeya variabilis]
MDTAEQLSSVAMPPMTKQEFTREFIEMYRSLPCLWKIKSGDYSNRDKRKAAYEKLITLCRQHNPAEKVDETFVKKKIQGLRTVWKKELNKVQATSKSGASTEEVYIPKLWYYDQLSFILDQEIPRPMTSMMTLLPVREEIPEEAQGQDISAVIMCNTDKYFQLLCCSNSLTFP